MEISAAVWKGFMYSINTSHSTIEYTRYDVWTITKRRMLKRSLSREENVAMKTQVFVKTNLSALFITHERPALLTVRAEHANSRQSVGIDTQQ